MAVMVGHVNKCQAERVAGKGRDDAIGVLIGENAKDNVAGVCCEFIGNDFRSGGVMRTVDPDLFFPERGASTREAKEVCRACVVRQECLEYALANGEKFGIWGGMSERERRRVRRQRATTGRRTISVSA